MGGEGVFRAVFVEIYIVNRHSPFPIFLLCKDWVCQLFRVCDFIDELCGKEPSNFYPNSLLSILCKEVEPLLDGLSLSIEI
jgi:hypothetical protein